MKEILLKNPEKHLRHQSPWQHWKPLLKQLTLFSDINTQIARATEKQSIETEDINQNEVSIDNLVRQGSIHINPTVQDRLTGNIDTSTVNTVSSL